MKFLITGLIISFLCVFCNDHDRSSANGVGGDSANTPVDSLSKRSSNKHLPSDTTNTISLSKNWNQEFILYDLPVNAREIAWLQKGVSHLQNKKISAVAQKTITDYQSINKGIKNYADVHRDFQAPEINNATPIDIGNHYGVEWDKAWIRKVIADQDSLLVMINRSFPSITDSILLLTLNNELPKIRSDLKELKQLE
jgi:hypothetical protein